MSHREGHSALHLHGGALVRGLEALHVQAQHRGQLANGHLLGGTALALAPATTGDSVPSIMMKTRDFYWIQSFNTSLEITKLSLSILHLLR